MNRDLRAAAAAVEAAAGVRGWNVRDLAAAARVDPATVTDFLAGRRWPRMSTRGALEKALGWPAGSIGTVAGGGDPPAVRTSAHDVGSESLELAAEVSRLPQEDRDAIRAVVRRLTARSPSPAPNFDLSRVEGLRIAEGESFRTVQDRGDRP